MGRSTGSLEVAVPHTDFAQVTWVVFVGAGGDGCGDGCHLRSPGPRVLLLFADVAHVALTFVGLPQSGWCVSDQEATNNAATTIICF